MYKLKLELEKEKQLTSQFAAKVTPKYSKFLKFI